MPTTRLRCGSSPGSATNRFDDPAERSPDMHGLSPSHGVVARRPVRRGPEPHLRHLPRGSARRSADCESTRDSGRDAAASLNRHLSERTSAPPVNRAPFSCLNAGAWALHVPIVSRRCHRPRTSGSSIAVWLAAARCRTDGMTGRAGTGERRRHSWADQR